MHGCFCKLFTGFNWKQQEKKKTQQVNMYVHIVYGTWRDFILFIYLSYETKAAGEFLPFSAQSLSFVLLKSESVKLQNRLYLTNTKVAGMQCYLKLM